MASVSKLIEVLAGFKRDHKKHNFSSEQLESIDDIIKRLNKLKNINKTKEYALYSTQFAAIIRLIMDLFK